MKKVYYLLVCSDDEYETNIVHLIKSQKKGNELIDSLIKLGLLLISSMSISIDGVKRQEYWINEENEDMLQLFDQLWIDSGVGRQAINGALFCLQDESPFILHDIFTTLKNLHYSPELLGYGRGKKIVLCDKPDMHVESLSLALVIDGEDDFSNDQFTGVLSPIREQICKYDFKRLRQEGPNVSI